MASGQQRAAALGGHLVRTLDRIRNKGLHVWLPGYARHLAAKVRTPRAEGPRHVLLAFCDHHEPLWGGAGADIGRSRMRAWVEGYPRLAREFRDADGRPPRHSFFFPGEQYAPEYMDDLAGLVRAGYGEVEFHLHHDGDTAETLRRDLRRYLDLFAGHGHFARDDGGRARFAFIHGNWCLANARRDGRMCGVDAEVPLLWDMGCYADFTFPSCPDESQPGIVNQIYWPTGDLQRRRSYESGVRARVGDVKADRVLFIQGPLGVGLRDGRLMPRVENGAVTAHDPATPGRIATWVREGIHVEGRPEWLFVKIHTHGSPETQAASLLGEAGRRMHQEFTTRWNDGERFALHYVTAREMYNIAMAAMSGKAGNPNDYRDFALAPPPAAGG